jgi:hypothetical protein
MKPHYKIQKKTDLGSVLSLLDEHRVEYMLYDTHQDVQWIRYFKDSTEWVIDSQDQDAVLFVRNGCGSSTG